MLSLYDSTVRKKKPERFWGKQQTFSDIEYSNRKRKTEREEFLDIMNDIIPWDEWVGLIQPLYFKGKRGRPPRGIEKNLNRVFVLLASSNLYSLAKAGRKLAVDWE